MTGYTKLFKRILDSTVWRENDKTRLLWITMLALADKDGIVQCTVPGLADRARITVKECELALKRFKMPDKYSWSKEDEGRRIRDVEGGWFLVNHAKYRALMSQEEMRERTRIRVENHRKRLAEEAAKKGKALQSVTPVTSNASNDIASTKAHTSATPVIQNLAIDDSQATSKVFLEVGLAGNEARMIVSDAVKACVHTGKTPEQAADHLIAQWLLYESTVKQYRKGVFKFFKEGLWKNPEAWKQVDKDAEFRKRVGIDDTEEANA